MVRVEGGSATVDVTVYSEVFDANKALFKEDEFLAVHGKVSEDRFSGGLRITAEKVMDIVAARQKFARSVALDVVKPVDTRQLRELLEPHLGDGGLPIGLRYRLCDAECELQLSDAWKVAPSDSLQHALEIQFGIGQVAIEYD